jgi:hypothetical protein
MSLENIKGNCHGISPVKELRHENAEAKLSVATQQVRPSRKTRHGAG